jgi:hypothetical protein
MSELELLQEELKGKLKAQDTNIKEIVDKIGQVQSQLEKHSEHGHSHEVVVDSSNASVIPSLEFYLTIATDITKVIRGLIKNQKNIPIDRLGSILRETEKAGDLSNVAFEIFKRFVVYD